MAKQLLVEVYEQVSTW